MKMKMGWCCSGRDDGVTQKRKMKERIESENGA
jgi:hypothetical protein